MAHDQGGIASFAQQSGDGGQSGLYVGKEMEVARAEVMQARMAVARNREALLRAAAVAELLYWADPALLRQLVALVVAEAALPWGIHQFDEALLAEGAELVVGIDEVITGIQSAVALDHRRPPTGLLVHADAREAAEHLAQHLLEGVDIDPADIAGDPMIVDLTQKEAESLGADGLGGKLNRAGLEAVESRRAGIFASWQSAFNNGDEL